MKRPIMAGTVVIMACNAADTQEVPEADGLARIPAGKFWRGCDPAAVEEWSGGSGNCDDDPRGDIALDVPMLEVYLSEYWMDEYEATMGEYGACFDAGVCPAVGTVVPGGLNEGSRNLPMHGLNWFEAETYCGWRGKRLPTEAEWEKAARGTDQRQLPWGDDYLACDLGNLPLGGPGDTCPEEGQIVAVDAYPKDLSPYGVVGMAGNVQEWVSDWKGQLYYATGPTMDPTGPAVPEEGYLLKIVRGGYFDAGPPSVRVSQRSWVDPAQHSLSGRVGVRCASSVPPAEINDPLAELIPEPHVVFLGE